MYDNEYEWDILLFLRILKYLHTSDTDKDEFSFFYVGELCAFWIRLITRKGDYDMYLNAYTKEENYQKYFDFLEKLRQSGETNMYGAAPYLQSEFPELRGSQKKANAILIAWIKSFEMKEGGEPC